MKVRPAWGDEITSRRSALASRNDCRIKERSVSMMRPRSIRRLFSLRVKSVDDIPWGLTSRSRRDLLYHFVGIQPNEGVGREGMSGAIIGMHMHDKTSTTTHTKTDNSTPEQSRHEQVHSRGQEGRIRRRWPRARRRAHHDLRCLCRGTAEAHTPLPPSRPRRRQGGRRGQEHGEGAYLV
jgi:hypothetical protein